MTTVPTAVPVARALAASFVVVFGALVMGGLTAPAQQLLPTSVNSLANSAGGWTAVAFVLVWLCRARPVLAVVLGVVAFEAMVEAYAIVSGWRGAFYADPFSSVWSAVGLLVGPVIGLAAAATRHGSRAWRLVGVAVLSLVLILDGSRGLLTLLGSTSPVYWTLEIVAGAAFFAAALWRTAPAVGRRHSARG